MTNPTTAILAAAVIGAGFISGCGSITSTPAEPIAESVEVAEAVEPEPTDYLAEGKQHGYSAAVAAQTATGNAWNDVGLGWDAAVRSLGKVPTDSPDYAEAQAKIAEYTANRDEARIRLVTQSGTKVGGSGMWGGSDISVDD